MTQRPTAMRQVEVNLSTATAWRRLDILSALFMTPLQGAATLALIQGVSPPTISRDLTWLKRHDLITSLLPCSCGSNNKHLFYLSSKGWTYLTQVLRTLGPVPTRTDGENRRTPYSRRLTRYRQRWNVLVPRLNHYVQLQELGDWLGRIKHDAIDGSEPRVVDTFEERHALPSKLCWRWIRPARLVFSYHGRLTTCSVDAVALSNPVLAEPPDSMQDYSMSAIQVTDETSETMSLVWVYLDDGVSSVYQLSWRLRQLLRFRYEHAIATEDFPLVLIRTASPQRAWQWARAVQHSAERLGIEPLQGALAFPVEPPIITMAGSDSTTTNVFESAWPLTQDGLATSPESTMLYARDLNWQLLMKRPQHQLSQWIPLVSWLFQPRDPQMVQILYQSLQSTGNPLTDHYGHLRMSGSQAHELLTTLPPSLPVVPSTNGASSVKRDSSVASADSLVQRLEHAATRWESLNPSERYQLLADLFERLERRHLSLLTLITTHPLISQEDLGVLVSLQPQSLVQRLSTLRQLLLIDQVEIPAPSSGLPTHGWRHAENTTGSISSVTFEHLRCLRVQTMGLHVLAALYDLPVLRLPFPQRPVPRLTSHDTGIRRFLGLLTEQSRDYNLAAVQVLSRRDLSERRLQLVWWKNAPAIVLRFPSQGEMISLRPDAAGELRWRALCERQDSAQAGQRMQFRRFWLEWDSGSENTRDLWDKFAAYQRYAQYQQESAPERILPALLVVAPNLRQEKRILRIVIELRSRYEAIVQPGAAVAATRSHMTEREMTSEQICWWNEQPTSEILPTASGHVTGDQNVSEKANRLLVHLTTTQRLGQHGPLGACWLTHALY